MADSDKEIIQDGNASPVLISLSQILEMVKDTIKEEKQWGRKPEAGTRKIAPISVNAYLSTLYNIIQGGLSRGINCVAIDRVVQAAFENEEFPGLSEELGGGEVKAKPWRV